MDADVDKKVTEMDYQSLGDDEKAESELPSSRIESNDEKISSPIGDMWDTHKSGNDNHDLNNVRDEAKDGTAVKSELVEQARPGSVTDETLSVGEETGEETRTKVKHGETICPSSTLQDQTSVEAAVDKQTEADGAVEENSDENGVECRNSATIVAKENPSGNIATGKSDPARILDGDSFQQSVDPDMGKENFESGETKPIQTEFSLHDSSKIQNTVPDDGPTDDVEIQNVTDVSNSTAVNDEPKEQDTDILADNAAANINSKTNDMGKEQEGGPSLLVNEHEPSTPNSIVYAQMGESDDGTPVDQAAFMKEIENFYRSRAMEFKPPKFYGQPLNCLKLWRAVIKLGGYDRVTREKLWRHVGESFHPPKTCTTVSWTFRIFYEKSLLEYERQKRQSGDIQLPLPAPPEASGAENEGNCLQAPVAGRARRDSAARAMQGWHSQRLSADGEISEPIIKEKNLNTAKREKNVKSIGSLKQKRSNEPEQSVKAARTEVSKQLVTSIDDVGPPADWVKINVRQNKDCFEVYALIPGLLREEIRVQSDPAGRVVITGQPEKVDNPWGITPFRKVVSLPARIDPLQTTAVVSVHGRLLVRLPFEP